ncbi:MAG: hypothetical protein ACI38Q_03360 [Candidatus Bruticola sp.]
MGSVACASSDSNCAYVRSPLTTRPTCCSNSQLVDSNSLFDGTTDCYAVSEGRVAILTAEFSQGGASQSSAHTWQINNCTDNCATLFFASNVLNDAEAEALSNEQLQAEYGRHQKISYQSQTEEQKCLCQSAALTQSQGEAVRMNELALNLKQSAVQMKQCALTQVTVGTALYASGVALEAAGKALSACPFSKAAGLALITKGKAMKQQGAEIQQAGKKLNLGAKNLLNSGFKLASSASRRLKKIADSWQKLGSLYRQVKEIGSSAEKSMNCVVKEGQKRGLNMIILHPERTFIYNYGSCAPVKNLSHSSTRFGFSSDETILPSISSIK